jgi:tRNA U34 5-methylaminomethyl-2-thiouridine-forming methyltransferase MnmC
MNRPKEVQESSRHHFQAQQVTERLEQINLPNEHFDLIYFDAFGPRVQPEMWTLDVFVKMFETLTIGGCLVTYCAKGEVKRTLKSAGFKVESLPGPPGKREMTRALK